MFANLFRTKPEKVEADLLYEARRLLIEHDAHAEHHKALADMYRARVLRLNSHPIGLTCAAGLNASANSLGYGDAMNQAGNHLNPYAGTAL